MSVTHTSSDAPPPSTPLDEAVDAVVEQGAAAMLADVHRIWPVKTGRSKFTLQRTPDGFSVGSTAPYAAAVRRRGEDSPVVEAHIPAIAERAAKQITANLDAIVRPYLTLQE